MCTKKSSRLPTLQFGIPWHLFRVPEFSLSSPSSFIFAFLSRDTLTACITILFTDADRHKFLPALVNSLSVHHIVTTRNRKPRKCRPDFGSSPVLSFPKLYDRLSSFAPGPSLQVTDFLFQLQKLTFPEVTETLRCQPHNKNISNNPFCYDDWVKGL